MQDCYKLLEKSKNEKSVQTANLMKKLKKSLKYLDNKVSKIQEGFRILEKNIKEEVFKILEKLEKLKNENLAHLESMKNLMELRMNELNWMEYFIKFQFNYRTAGDYVDNFFTHQRLQQFLYTNTMFPTEETIRTHGDYVLEGGLDIIDMRAKRREDAEQQAFLAEVRRKEEEY